MTTKKLERAQKFRFDPNQEPWPEPNLNFGDVADYLATTSQHRLNEGEADFILNMQAWPKQPTDKQLAWLYSIYRKVG